MKSKTKIINGFATEIIYFITIFVKPYDKLFISKYARELNDS